MAAFALLARLGEQKVPATAEGALFSGSTGDRMAAIESLWGDCRPQAVPLLLRAAGDPRAALASHGLRKWPPISARPARPQAASQPWCRCCACW